MPQGTVCRKNTQPLRPIHIEPKQKRERSEKYEKDQTRKRQPSSIYFASSFAWCEWAFLRCHTRQIVLITDEAVGCRIWAAFSLITIKRLSVCLSVFLSVQAITFEPLDTETFKKLKFILRPKKLYFWDPVSLGSSSCFRMDFWTW